MVFGTKKELPNEKLLLAAWHGDLERCRKYIAKGASPTARNADAGTALHNAAAHASVLRYLLGE
jgi:hypothetical protein